MRVQDLRIRALDGAMLVDGQFTLHGDPAVVAHFAVPELAAVGVRLRPDVPNHWADNNWSFQGFDAVQPGADGLWATGKPVLDLSFGPSVPTFTSLVAMFLPQGPTGFSLTRKEGVRLGQFAVPLANPGLDQPHLTYIQFDALDVDLALDPAGLTIGITARMADLVRPVEGLNVAGLELRGRVFIPSIALVVQMRGPFRMGPDGEAVRSVIEGGALALQDLGITNFGSLAVEGQVDWGQSGDGRIPLGPFVALDLQERTMGFEPVGHVRRLANGLLKAESPTSDGPYMRINLGLDDFIRALETQDEAEMRLHGSWLGHIVGKTGRDAYEEGDQRQDLIWLDLKLQRTAAGLLIGGKGDFGGGPRSPAARVGQYLDFAFFLPRRLLLARGMRVPRYANEWKRDLPDLR